MEEERRNSPGLFYAITGVATLVVAIIGATFAYFSASAQVTGNNELTGGTNSDLSNALSATVERIRFEASGAGSDDLVPSDIEANTTSINNAINAKCVDEGYTGCHLYKITISSKQNVAAADLKLASMELDGPKDKVSWKYVIYTSANNDNTANEVKVTSNNFEDTDVSIHSTGLTASQDVVYYLLVYIANDVKNAQNEGNDKDVTGTYKGTVTFTAANGGQVSATFTAGA